MKAFLILALLASASPALAEPFQNADRRPTQQHTKQPDQAKGDAVNCFGQERGRWASGPGGTRDDIRARKGDNSDFNDAWRDENCPVDD